MAVSRQQRRKWHEIKKRNWVLGNERGKERKRERERERERKLKEYRYRKRSKGDTWIERNKERTKQHIIPVNEPSQIYLVPIHRPE